jgi:hypothetical protein
MDINQRIMKFRQKCINKLNRRDAEFFLDIGTIKDLSVFSSLVKLKSLTFKDEFELEMMLVRYLQILMILSSVSDDPRDEQLVERYMQVPFECEEIIKMRGPYRNPDNIDLIFQLIKKRYPLHAYWEAGGYDTEMLQAAIPKKSTEVMDDILSYYSTPILGITAVLEIRPPNFDFLQELKDLLKFDLHDHLRNHKRKVPKENQHVNMMNWVIKFNLKKSA